MTTQIIPTQHPDGRPSFYVVPSEDGKPAEVSQVISTLLTANLKLPPQPAPAGTNECKSESSDSETEGQHTQAMNEHVTRPEIDAKLETIEARMDARLERFDKDVREIVNGFRLEMAPVKNMKASIWGSTAVIVGTIVAAVSMSFGAFDSGRETAKLVQEMRQQSFETRQLLEQIKTQQSTAAAATARTSNTADPDTPDHPPANASQPAGK